MSLAINIKLAGEAIFMSGIWTVDSGISLGSPLRYYLMVG